MRTLLPLFFFLVACAGTPRTPSGPLDGCALDAPTTAWMQRWFDAWRLTQRDILKVGPQGAPPMVLFDARCVWTTSDTVAPAGRQQPGPALGDTPLRWRTAAHHGHLSLPHGKRVPVQLMSFAAPAEQGGEGFFVMAAPSVWEQARVTSDLGLEKLLVAVFLHEMTHTRQFYAFLPRMDALTQKWALPDDLNDDAVQERFSGTPEYVAAYHQERDLLFAAAAASTAPESRALASQALALMKQRHAQWFTGADERYRELDSVFLTLEGIGQWAAYQWTRHPLGGGVEPTEALKGIRRGGTWWSQDEGLALCLVLDRLLPTWTNLAFAPEPLEVPALLERALGNAGPPSGHHHVPADVVARASPRRPGAKHHHQKLVVPMVDAASVRR
jgi:hypothetical protein